MADKILPLIPSSLHDQLFQEVTEALEQRKSQAQKDKFKVDPDIIALAKKQNDQALRKQNK